MGWPRPVSAQVVRVGLVVNRAEYQARLVTCREESHLEFVAGHQCSSNELASQAPFQSDWTHSSP